MSAIGRYEYADGTWREIELLLALALPPSSRLVRSEKQEDYAGTDGVYYVGASVPVAVRVRYNRPPYAPDVDVTYRITEPAKIAAGTYAPLLLFAWINDGVAAHGKLVDVYRWYNATRDANRVTTSNGDRTAWFPVPIEELYATRALLRQGNRREWGEAWYGATDRVADIVATYKAPPVSQLGECW